jgi:hypothetical protein
MRRSRAALVLALLLAGGCVPPRLFDWSTDTDTRTVPASPFGAPGPAAPVHSTASYTQASTDIATRVDFIGRKVLAANPEAGLRPLFATHGSPQPEIFHQGTKVVNITDSLVKQCQTDAQLAAVLALELAKMVSEREALAPAGSRRLEVRPPIDVPIGNAAQADAFEQARMAELARYDRQRQLASQPLPPPDPQVLARVYLEKAGYSRADLESVRPLLKQAEGNYILEKGYRASGTAPGARPLAFIGAGMTA